MMHTRPTHVPHEPPDRPAVTRSQWSPNPVTTWTLRILSCAGLGVAIFLSGAHYYAQFAAGKVATPYCRLLTFFDCDTVLNSEWATWFGVPVSLLGAGAYLLLVAGFFLKPRQEVWTWLRVPAFCIALSAAWFIYLQSVRLDGAFCMWCMSEHAIGLTVLFLLLLYGPAAVNHRHRVVLPGLDEADVPRETGPLIPPGPTVAAAWMMAALPAAVLVLGQSLDSHTYAVQGRNLIGSVTEGRYDEAGEAEEAYEMFDGRVRLVPSKHPVIGRVNAPYVVVEVVDYTCPRCARFNKLLPEARRLLGVDYAFMVVTSPQSHYCNKHYAQEFNNTTDAMHENACELAELAHAVWIVNPGRFETFHEWLFEHHAELREMPDLARRRAEELVGKAALDAAFGTGRAPSLVQRDVEIVQALGAGPLPGLYTPHAHFKGIPEAADTLAVELHNQFHNPAEAVNPQSQ